MVGIIGAMEIEVEQLKNMMKDVVVHMVGKLEFYEGILLGVRVVAAISGVGKVNSAVCTQTMILKFSPDVIINIGVAGGLNNQLKIGDIAIATQVVQHDMDTSALGDPIGFISGLDIVQIPCAPWAVDIFKKAADKIDSVSSMTGIIASGDQFINRLEKKEWIKENFHAIAVEMEGAAIGQVCFINGVDFCVIRAISDSADDDSHLSFREFAEMAAKNSIFMILSFLKIMEEKFRGKN
ncbi:MAG: 5'-methylthioadenosine/adenosylhomocysteine nucleosidase [Clostridia bacterium]|nr:5'-methylthioadenosine/adenosylhomocysteine nucleosidase [Clostridia bacterium]